MGHVKNSIRLENKVERLNGKVKISTNLERKMNRTWEDSEELYNLTF